MDKRFLTVLGMSVLLALLVSGIFYQITVRTNSPRREKYATKDLVVATADLPLGATIKPSDLHVVKWPVDNYPKGGYAKIEEVVERAVTSNVLAEEPVVAGRVSEKNAGMGLSSIIPTGMRAVSVRVNDVIGVAGFVLPGSRVDVLITGTPPAGGDTRMTTTVLQNILIISAGTKIQPDARGQAENVPVVTMLVTPEQAETLTLAANEGRIQLVLRNPTDEKTQKPAGVRLTSLYAGGAPEKPKAEPKARPVRVAPVVVAAAPPPPPPPPPAKPQVEMIRGEKRAVETVAFEKNE